MRRILFASMATFLVHVLVGTALAEPVTLQRYRWKRTRELVATVSLTERTIRAIARPKTLPLTMASVPDHVRGSGAIVGVNSDFGCHPNDGRRVNAPQHAFMQQKEIWTTGRGSGGAVYLQGAGRAWVERAAIDLRLDLGGGSLHVAAVNPCSHRNQLTLYTPIGGKVLTPPPNRCYTKLFRQSEPDFAAGGDAIVTNYLIGRTACQAEPLTRPLLSWSEGKKLRFPEGEAAAFAVRVGHPYVETIIGGNWLTVQDGVNVAPSDAQGKDCGISQCPDGYMSGKTPRTNLCVDATGQVAYMIAVDGEPANRAGLTPPQMGRFAVRFLGAQACVNLDGGGSTTMVYRGRLVSRPSYGYPRAVMYSTAVFRV